MSSIKISGVPGGTVFHLGNDDYYLKTKAPIILEGVKYHAIAFGTGQPAFTEDGLDQEVNTSKYVFTQPD